jgi:hypothetical protein
VAFHGKGSVVVVGSALVSGAGRCVVGVGALVAGPGTVVEGATVEAAASVATGMDAGEVVSEPISVPLRDAPGAHAVAERATPHSVVTSSRVRLGRVRRGVSTHSA